ncbi:MAG TPA: MinD/ParA family protein [Phycisphaerae bacterium]|nr:MinD/ParA family protein [Phycisphaerae bacterium]
MARQDKPIHRYDQAGHLRRLVGSVDPGRGRAAHVVAVVSGKGGVGKTMIAANLAIALAAREHRVVLLDMDMGLANADIVLGVEPSCNWSDVLSGRGTLDDVLCPAPGGIDFVPGCSGIARAANLSEFERHQLLAAMREIEQRYDVLVLDCGAGISRNVLGLASSADTVLVVTTPEPTAVTDAYATIKLFARDREMGSAGSEPVGSFGLVVNEVTSRREGRETFERLAGVAARFLHVPVSDFGYVLRDDDVTIAVRQRVPVLLAYPRCPASSCLIALAGRLSRELGQPETRQSLFYRVINLFI